MNQKLQQQRQTIFNEIAQGKLVGSTSIAERLRELGVLVPPEDERGFIQSFFRLNLGVHFVPSAVLDVTRLLLEGRSAGLVCDPNAGTGVLASIVGESVGSRRTLACEPNRGVFIVSRYLTPKIEWRNEDPFEFLESLVEPVDVVATVPPFGMRLGRPVEVRGGSGEFVQLRGDYASLLVAAAASRLSSDGIGIFVVTPSFFLSRQSIVRDLPQLGLGVQAALMLPAGSFEPLTSVSGYLVVVRKTITTQMFVAGLSTDAHTNRQVVANLREGRADGAVELGRFVSPEEFRGLDLLRLGEQLRRAERQFQATTRTLGDLAVDIRLGRAGEGFAFPASTNAFYIPLIGISDIVDSNETMTLKPQNYAQVVVNEGLSDARFVGHFLNSELGRAVRETSKFGVIPKLNKASLRTLPVLVPSLATQRKILEIEARLLAENNTVLGLQNDLDSLRRRLWSAPDQLDDIAARVQELSDRLVHGARPHVVATLEAWFETLPFPLASILRAWQASPTQDWKAKYEHLLHFFEAAAEFFSIIYLSAYYSQPEAFADHREKLLEAWQKQRLTIERATFGTWKVVFEYLSGQTRRLLSGDADKRAQCAALFCGSTNVLPMMLAQKELATVLSSTNKMRNDWTGHGGVVSQTEAKLRNEQLLSELQKLREVMADGWRTVQLIRCLQCRPRGGAFDNEVAVLVGSNSEFLKESRSMSMWLNVDRLYLGSSDSGRALELLPLIHVGPSPESARNACYFFNRVEQDGARFVSYHFEDQPELKDHSADTAAAVRLLSSDQFQIIPG